jgi:hypothetical protein
MSDRAKTIPELNALTAPVGGDLLIIEDVSANTTKKITVTDLSQNFPFNGNAQYTYSNTVVFDGLVRATLPIFQGDASANATLGFDIQSGALGNFQANIDFYAFFYIVNANTGAQASADLTLYNDSWLGAQDKWIDLGISSSNYSNSGWTVVGQNDGYLYTANSNLAIGSNTHNVYLFAGGTLVANRKATIAANGITITSNLTINAVFAGPPTTKASNAAGNAGEMCWDASYIYVCTAANTWKRATLNTY